MGEHLSKKTSAAMFSDDRPDYDDPGFAGMVIPRTAMNVELLGLLNSSRKALMARETTSTDRHPSHR
jgi:hypothetical protein